MHSTIFASPTELAVTTLAVVLVGLSKGGLGGMSLLGVPLMALVMPPVTAAAILLPVLVVMDVVSVASWRAWVDWQIIASDHARRGRRHRGGLGQRRACLGRGGPLGRWPGLAGICGSGTC